MGLEMSKQRWEKILCQVACKYRDSDRRRRLQRLNTKKGMGDRNIGHLAIPCVEGNIASDRGKYIFLRQAMFSNVELLHVQHPRDNHRRRNARGPLIALCSPERYNTLWDK